VRGNPSLPSSVMSDTPIADMVAKMLSGGIPVEVIILAVQAAERTQAITTRASVREDTTANRRRAWDRERKRRKRIVTNETSTGQEKSLSLSSLPSMSIGVVRKKEQNSTGNPVEIHRKTKSRGSRLPETWNPSSKHYQEGLAMGRDRIWVDEQAQDMRLWEMANHHRPVARKSDWDATFSNWMRRNRSKNGVNGYGKAPSGIMAALDQHIENLSGGSSEVRENVVRLLPNRGGE